MTASFGTERRGGHRRTLATAMAAVMAAAVLWSVGDRPAGAATAQAALRSGPGLGIAGSDGTISHDGRWLTDDQGRVVLLHGVNLVAKGTQTPAQRGFDGADAKWLVQHGFDVVRLGLTAAALMPEPGQIDTAYLDSFMKTADMLTAHGLLVLIDLHQDGWGPTLGSDGFPSWMTITNGATNTGTPFPYYYVTNPAVQAAFQSFWDNVPGPNGTPLQDDVAAMFKVLAAGAAGNPGVLGYDLLNEPWPGTTWSGCVAAPKGCPAEDHDELDPYYARMTTTIRAEDPDHLLFGEPWVLFNFGESKTHIGLPGDDPESGMSFHLYTLTPDTEPTLLHYATQWSASTGGALLNTEFGATDDPVAIDRQVDELDGNLIPWIFWSFDGYLAENLQEPPSASNSQSAVVAALVRPHPVLVAGTPTSFAYDESTRTLRFRYYTTGPTGIQFGPSTPTEFDVPASVYPSGWQATVKGGTVVRHTAKGALEVVADPGATAVAVTVSPSTAGG